MATIRIEDERHVYIDDQLAGGVLDVVRNHPGLASDVQRAFVAYGQEWDRKAKADIEAAAAEHGKAAKAAAEALSAQHAVAVQKLRDEHAGAVQTMVRDHAAAMDAVHQEHAKAVGGLRAKLAAVTAERDALGTTEQGQAALKRLKLERARQQHAELTAFLAQHDAPKD